MNPSGTYPKENICKMNQFVTNHYWGEPGLINMSKLPFVKKNYVVQAEIRVQSDQVR